MEKIHLLNHLESGMCARRAEHGAAQVSRPLKEQCRTYFKVLLRLQGGGQTTFS